MCRNNLACMQMNRILLILLIIALVFVQNIKAQPGTGFTPVNATGVPYSIIIASITLNGGSLPDSTEIAVFNDTLCVGYTKYEGNANQQLVAWEGDQSMGLAGFVPGQTMIFKVRLLVNSTYYIIDAIPTYSEGTGEFGYGNFTVVDLSVTSTIVSKEEISLKESLIGYPNPFTKQIYFNLQDNAFKTVDILDYTGRIIYRENLKNSNHFIWYGINNNGIKSSEGLYFIVFSSENNSKIVKVVYQ